MSGRAFAVLMDEREEAARRVESARAELDRLERSVVIAQASLSGAQSDLEDIEGAMHKVDPASMAILTGNTEPEGQVER